MSRRIILGIAAGCLIPSHVAAQSVWLPPTDTASVAVEYVQPHIPNDDYGSGVGIEHPWIQGAVFLSGAQPLSRWIRFLVELPVATLAGRNNDCTDVVCEGFHAAAVLGNPYVGMDGPIGGRSLRWQAGVRLPIQWVDDLGSSAHPYQGTAAEVGLLAGELERQTAFRKGVTTALARVEARPHLGVRTDLRAWLGTAYVHDPDLRFVSTNGVVAMDQTNVFEYDAGAIVWHRHDPVLFSLGVAAVNRPYFVDERKTSYQWAGAAGVTVGRWTPMLQARLRSDLPEADRWHWWTLALALQKQVGR